MKISRKSIVVAILILVFFTALPLASPRLIPSEFFKAFSMMGGIDIMALLNKVAVIGLAMSVLVLLKGSVEKASQAGLALSIISKLFWLVIVLFALGIGKIENFGLATLGGGNGALNVVIFDLRLIALLATIIVALKVIHSILKFKETKPETIDQEPKPGSQPTGEAKE